MQQTVLITTSGIGNRLGDLTKFTNKSLVAVGDKPAISRIIENYPRDTQFVITLGYQGEAVREFLEIAYPEQIFEFVTVDKYDGLGSSLGYSMLRAADLLNKPFIFHASDTLVNQSFPVIAKNWLAGYRGENAAEYSSFDCLDEVVTKTHSKGMDNFDFLYIGIAGIYSHHEFWKTLRKLYEENPNNPNLNDISAIQKLIDMKYQFSVVIFDEWEDVGNIGALTVTREKYKRELETLAKNNEDIFKVNEKVIKYFSDEKVCSQRIQRSKILAPAVPAIDSYNNHFYSYNFLKGTIASDGITKESFSNLLVWAEANIWSKKIEKEPDNQFKVACYNFYFVKTANRILDYFSKTGQSDSEQQINGAEVPTVTEIMQLLENEKLDSGVQTVIHGDFILDNILKTDDGFMAIDWRQDFSSLVNTGDLYYDLAKLNHSLTMNHHSLNSGLFKCSVSRNKIAVDLEVRENLHECGPILETYLKTKGLSIRKVKIITALIWINMSPLHNHPLDIFLFHFGKFHLWNALNSNESE